MLNAFTVDVEEWFHICGVESGYDDPQSWTTAPASVVRNTERLMRLLDAAKVRGTFFVLGWVAEHHPELIRRLADAGHEIGCHSHMHELVYTLTPEEFERDLERALTVLREVSGQPVSLYRAPGFSMVQECLWALPIMRKHGIEIDSSVVPAGRDNGGIEGFPRDPIKLTTVNGRMTLFPLSVMSLGPRMLQFSGGGYLRLFPMGLIRLGYWQNLRKGRACLSYIHPREIDAAQPRMKLPPLKYFKYYFGLRSTEDKLRSLLQRYAFGTVSDALRQYPNLAEYVLTDTRIQPVCAA